MARPPVRLCGSVCVCVLRTRRGEKKEKEKSVARWGAAQALHRRSLGMRVLVIRHGERADEVDEPAIDQAPAPHNPPLSVSGWEQVREERAARTEK